MEIELMLGGLCANHPIILINVLKIIIVETFSSFFFPDDFLFIYAFYGFRLGADQLFGVIS